MLHCRATLGNTPSMGYPGQHDACAATGVPCIAALRRERYIIDRYATGSGAVPRMGDLTSQTNIDLTLGLCIEHLLARSRWSSYVKIPFTEYSLQVHRLPHIGVCSARPSRHPVRATVICWDRALSAHGCKLRKSSCAWIAHHQLAMSVQMDDLAVSQAVEKIVQRCSKHSKVSETEIESLRSVQFVLVERKLCYPEQFYVWPTSALRELGLPDDAIRALQTTFAPAAPTAAGMVTFPASVS